MKKILFILTVCAMIVIGGNHDPAFAWLRDANLAASSDSVGFGWAEGFCFMGEKMIDQQTSIGFYGLPSFNFLPEPVEIYQLSYNKQIFGEKNGSYSFTCYLGILHMNLKARSDLKMEYYPDIGMAFKWKLSDTSTFRLQTLYFWPFFIEYANMIRKNLELGLSLGYPFQLISLKYIFN